MVDRATLAIWTWRLGAWGALSVATALAAKGLPAQISSGVTLALGALACQFIGDRRSVRMSTVMIIIATVLGLTSTLLSHQGLGEVPVYVAASRVGFPIDRGWGRVFVVADTIATAVVVGYISRSFIGALAGLGVPLVAQRAVERRKLIASRDEAQALLVEVQSGRDAEAQAAALRERGRIARDLHDVLAHSLAALSVQLQATRAVAARENVGAAVLEPLDKAATLARDGLGEARAVVSALRDPVVLGVDAIPSLVERHPGDVTLDVDGEPIAVTADAGHTMYRAVQEALTNAARYAPGSPVRVELRYGGDGLSVCVSDSGLPSGRERLPSQGTGLGLAGMNDRVREVGGTLSAGPRPDGGWQVQVWVPKQ